MNVISVDGITWKTCVRNLASCCVLPGAERVAALVIDGQNLRWLEVAWLADIHRWHQ